MDRRAERTAIWAEVVRRVVERDLLDLRAQRPQHERGCPDAGKCHHMCEQWCWRVFNAEPLSAAEFPEDRWPVGIVGIQKAAVYLEAINVT